ncbi:centromere protein P-like [Amphiura filiformis]|uniref:centromere protein P-like n=1 Tax=Amphiura filiformis TaxID=82378 RepID=UPI003B21FCEE
MATAGSRESSEIDGYVTVQNALKGYVEGNDETSMSSDDIDKFIDTLASPKEMAQYYKKEMEQLQKEIESLEESVEADKQKLLEIPASVLEEIKSQIPSSNATGVEDDEKLLAIFKQLQVQTTFSKIAFTDTTVKMMKQSQNKTISAHHIQGNSFGLDFSADFEVTETKIPEGEAVPQILAGQETKATITKLKALVDEQVQMELNDIIQEIQKTCALEPFLNGYAQYAEWFRHRENTFIHFKKEYESAVMLPQGSTGPLLQFSHPDNNGAVYIVSWSIPFNLSGRTEPSIDLHVKASAHMNQIDQRNILKSAPEEFQKMLTSLGVEKALDSIIQAVAT